MAINAPDIRMNTNSYKNNDNKYTAHVIDESNLMNNDDNDDFLMIYTEPIYINLLMSFAFLRVLIERSRIIFLELYT